MSDYDGMCSECGQWKQIAASHDGKPVCFECIPDDVIAAIQEQSWAAKETLPSRMRAVMLSARLMDAFMSGDPGGAQEIVKGMNPADYYQTMGALAARAAAYQAAIDGFAPGGAGAVDAKLTEKLCEQDDDADMFAMFAAMRAT